MTPAQKRAPANSPSSKGVFTHTVLLFFGGEGREGGEVGGRYQGRQHLDGDHGQGSRVVRKRFLAFLWRDHDNQCQSEAGRGWRRARAVGCGRQKTVGSAAGLRVIEARRLTSHVPHLDSILTPPTRVQRPQKMIQAREDFSSSRTSARIAFQRDRTYTLWFEY